MAALTLPSLGPQARRAAEGGYGEGGGEARRLFDEIGILVEPAEPPYKDVRAGSTSQGWRRAFGRAARWETRRTSRGIGILFSYMTWRIK